MEFNSYTFLLFFGCVLVLHLAPIPWRVKKLNLLIASYLFYAAWNPIFVLLLWASTLVDWFVARANYRSDSMRRRRVLVAVSLVVNLGFLAFFKYGGFVLENFVLLVQAAGFDYKPAAPNLILPVGISFYTFQTLSYSLDVHARRIQPWHSFLDYALYVTFFPQLVAGPIVRAGTFLPQCNSQGVGELGRGLALFVLGIFMKVVVADGLLAPVVEDVFDNRLPPDWISAWLGTFAFAGQIFCDFAGYSTCAIGVAACLGFRLPRNFHFPYAAAGFSDFWRRWHISLSTWLRDYLYISLGGNRRGSLRTQINLGLTMLLGGLWHGASWNFLIWGGLHGLFLIAERPFLPRLDSNRSFSVRLARMIATFLCVSLAWVFFRANTLHNAIAMLGTMLGMGAPVNARVLTVENMLIASSTMAVLLAVHFALRDKDFDELIEQSNWWVRGALLAAMLISIVTMPGEDRSFIYFQF